MTPTTGYCVSTTALLPPLIKVKKALQGNTLQTAFWEECSLWHTPINVGDFPPCKHTHVLTHVYTYAHTKTHAHAYILYSDIVYA